MNASAWSARRQMIPRPASRGFSPLTMQARPATNEHLATGRPLGRRRRSMSHCFLHERHPTVRRPNRSPFSI